MQEAISKGLPMEAGLVEYYKVNADLGLVRVSLISFHAIYGIVLTRFHFTSPFQRSHLL